MDKQQTIEAIKVMQAFVDGAEIEMNDCPEDWQETHDPFWNWYIAKYRIKDKNEQT